jgi:hypothetical protein
MQIQLIFIVRYTFGSLNSVVTHVLTVTVGHRRHCRAIVRNSHFVLNLLFFLTQRSYYAKQVYTREFFPSSSVAPSYN